MSFSTLSNSIGSIMRKQFDIRHFQKSGKLIALMRRIWWGKMCATYKEVIIEFSAARVVVANKHLFIESNDRGKKKCKVFGTFQKRWSHRRRQDKSKHKFTPKKCSKTLSWGLFSINSLHKSKRHQQINFKQINETSRISSLQLKRPPMESFWKLNWSFAL